MNKRVREWMRAGSCVSGPGCLADADMGKQSFGMVPGGCFSFIRSAKISGWPLFMRFAFPFQCSIRNGEKIGEDIYSSLGWWYRQ